MDFLKTWLGRLIFAAAGVVLIAVSASQHTGKWTAGVVTGVACVLFALYATIRGLAGSVEASDGPQVIGLIDVSKWYDFVVLSVLTLISVIAWIVA
jgi:hypothetical protein